MALFHHNPRILTVEWTGEWQLINLFSKRVAIKCGRVATGAVGGVKPGQLNWWLQIAAGGAHGSALQCTWTAPQEPSRSTDFGVASGQGCVCLVCSGQGSNCLLKQENTNFWTFYTFHQSTKLHKKESCLFSVLFYRPPDQLSYFLLPFSAFLYTRSTLLYHFCFMLFSFHN